MGCAASTNPAAPASPPAATHGFDPAAPYRLDPQVALRPEPFGALAYHYGNRRLTFVRAPELVDVLRLLDGHASVDAAIDAASIPARRRPAFRKALAALADSEVIRAR